MDLPAEIIELILANASYKDVCKAKIVSRNWRDAAIDLLRRDACKRKTLEERVQFLLFKIQKQAKKSGKKDKILKEDLNKLLTYALDTNVMLELPAIVNHRNAAQSIIRLWLYAEDDLGLWDYFDKVMAKSDKVHIRSPLLIPYLQHKCRDLYELNLDLLDDAIDKNANLNLEVDPAKGGRPENAENLVKVFKQYFDALLPTLEKMNKATLGWLQHIHKKFADMRLLKAILVMNFLTPSILSQSADRDIHRLGPKKPKPEPIIRVRKYILICKILTSAMLGNTHKEDFLRGADACTAQVALQLEDVIKRLMTIEVDPSDLFRPFNFSVSEIFEALSIIKSYEGKKPQ